MSVGQIKVSIQRRPTLKIEVQRSPVLKLKVLPKFPSSVTGTGGIDVTNVAGNYVISPTLGVLGDVTGPGTAALVNGELAIFTDSHHIEGTGVQATSFMASAIGVTMDGGGGAPLTAGYQVSLQVPFDCTIVKSTLLGDSAGNLAMDVKKSTFATFPTATSICAAAFPTLTAAQAAQDSTLTGWTTSLLKGDILEFYVTGAPTISKATLSLDVTRA